MVKATYKNITFTYEKRDMDFNEGKDGKEIELKYKNDTFDENDEFNNDEDFRYLPISLCSYNGINLVNNEVITTEKDIAIVINYPLDGNYEFHFIKDVDHVFDTKSLISLIKTFYKYIYSRGDEFGIWGHSFDQLFLDGLKMKDGKIYCVMGS